MTTKQANIEFVLPYGEALRTFIEQPFITKGDLRSFLRSRGIFVGTPSKEETIPVAICCLFSPLEFDRLKELQNHREDNLKTINEFLQWDSDKNLIDAVPDLDVSSLLGDGHSYCKVVGQPTFVPVGNNPNHLRLDFEMERQDHSKSWATTTNVYKGSVSIEKVYEGKNVRLVLTHTAAETKHLNHQITAAVKTHFKETGSVPTNSDKTQILFTDFSNEERVKFFFSLTGNNNTEVLEFVTVCDLDVCPDETGGALPEQIKWMEKHVSDLKLKGTNLHETFFIKDVQYHKSLRIYKMDAKFSYRYHAAAGTCTISFEFACFDNDDIRPFEFETNICALSVDEEFHAANKTAVKEHLLRTIQLFAYDQYRSIVQKSVPS